MNDHVRADNSGLREGLESNETCGDVIGTSDAIQYTIGRIRQVARTMATVLLHGETGTGKGVFAHFLHRESDRRDRPFVNVNCAGLPANLIESELCQGTCGN